MWEPLQDFHQAWSWLAGWLAGLGFCIRGRIRMYPGIKRDGGWAALKNDFLLAAATTRYPSSICREYNVFAPPMFKSVELLHILQNNSSSFFREYQVFAPPMFKSAEPLHISQTECLRLRILAQAQEELFSCIQGTGRVLVDV